MGITTRQRASLALAAAALVLGVGGACGSGSSSTDSGAPTPTPLGTNAPKTTVSVVATLSAPCEKKPLAEGLAKAKPDATLGDFACSSTFAVATVEGPGLAQFGEAGWFNVVADGQWTLIKTVKVDGNEFASAPEGFPRAIYEQWLSAYKRPSRTSTTLCLFYDPSTNGCTDKAPPGYEGPGATTATEPSGNV
jgi:hypothetical protein